MDEEEREVITLSTFIQLKTEEEEGSSSTIIMFLAWFVIISALLQFILKTYRIQVERIKEEENLVQKLVQMQIN